MREPAPLHEPLKGLVEAEKKVPVPSELRDRVLRRARVSETPRSGRLIEQPRRTWSRVRVAAGAAIMLASGVAGASIWRIIDRKESARIVISVPPATGGPGRSQAAVPASDEGNASRPTWEPAPVRPRGGARARPDSDRNPGRVPATSREELRPPKPVIESAGDPSEVAILDKARASVARGAFAHALSPIAEHAVRFPQGRLAEEREALRVKALSGLGRAEEARRAAAAFRARFPGSVLLPRIEELAPTRK